MCEGPLQIRRDGDSTVIGYRRGDGSFAAVRIADDADAETIARQLEALAESVKRVSMDFGQSFNPLRQSTRGR